MKKYSVHIVEDAEADIKQIVSYICDHDASENATHVLIRLQETCESLARLPARGHIPPELRRVGVTKYRELHFKPYRVIYEIRGTRVYIHCILDGRRDLQAALELRLLR